MSAARCAPEGVFELARPEIRALTPYASARSVAAASGILLNANENPWAPPGGAALRLNRYPDPQPSKLRTRLAGHYGVDPDNLLITRGSDEGIDLLTRTFCRPGLDRVLVCPPCFGMYAISARIQGCAVIEVPLIDHGAAFAFDPQGIGTAPACRLYFLCSPNNPTGNCIEPAQVVALAEQVSNHGLVVIDEAYVEFQRGASLAKQVAHTPNLVVLRTLSKAFALAACRIGVVIAGAVVIDLLRRIIAPYPLPGPAVAAALSALSGEALKRQARQIRTLHQEKSRLLEGLRRHSAIRQIWPGEANFILIRAADGPALVAAARAAGILLRDQSGQPGLENAIRITVGARRENTALLNFLETWPP